MISPEDLDLVHVTDDPEEAAEVATRTGAVPTPIRQEADGR
jgi:hypothetical protein